MFRPIFFSVLLFTSVSFAAAPKIEKIDHPSKLLGTTEWYLLMLPPGYDDPANAERRYPVIYATQTRGQEFTALRQLMDSGALPPMIVVGSDVDGGETAWSNLKRPTEDYFIKELLPDIDAKYRTVTDRPGRVLYGQSKGGSGTVRLLLKHPNLFAAGASLDGAMNLYDVKDYEKLGETFKQLLEKGGDTVKQRPVLLIGGGWFGERAVLYEKLLREWGMQHVARVDAPYCGHSGKRMLDEHGVLSAVTWTNGLLPSMKHAAPKITMGEQLAGTSAHYYQPQQVTLAGESGTTIRYTLDGTPPRAESTKFEKPLAVEKSCVLRAACFDSAGKQCSPEAAAQFRFLTMLKGEGAASGAAKPGWELSWYDEGISRERASDAKPAGQKTIAALPAEIMDVPAKRMYIARTRLLIDKPGIYSFDVPNNISCRVGSGAWSAEPKGTFAALEAGLHTLEFSGYTTASPLKLPLPQIKGSGNYSFSVN